MVASAMTRRDALAAVGAFGLSLTCAASDARAQNGLRFRGVVVNVEPLRALTGDPTAAWMEQALRQALPRVLGPDIAPRDRNAAFLEVQIDWIYLAPSPGGPGPRACATGSARGSTSCATPYFAPSPSRPASRGIMRAERSAGASSTSSITR